MPVVRRSRAEELAGVLPREWSIVNRTLLGFSVRFQNDITACISSRTSILLG